MLRLRSNCKVIWQEPCELVEFILSSPAMVVNCRSRGVATADATVSALAPGKLALTVTVGKSTAGRSLTERVEKAISPKMTTAAITRVVITGLRMKSFDRFIPIYPNLHHHY